MKKCRFYLTVLCNTLSLFLCSSLKGGSYVLPMRWKGIPISLLCPQPSAAAPDSTMTPTDMPIYPQYPHPLFPYFPFFPPFAVTMAAPTTASTAPSTTITTTEDPAAHHPGNQWPFPSLYETYPWGLPGFLPAPAKAPATHRHHHKHPFPPFPGNFPLYPYFPYNYVPPYAQ